MTNMFTNYENLTTAKRSCKHKPLTNLAGSPSVLTNIKGEFLGVQVKHELPFTLYFHIENFYLAPNKAFWEDIFTGTTVFRIFTTNGKIILEKTIPTLEIFNTETCDLAITIFQEEAKKLKKETYTLSVSLITESSEHKLFAERDGYLVVR